MMKQIPLFIAIITTAIIFSCSKSDRIIEEAVEVSGYQGYSAFSVKFDIQDTHYIANRTKDGFSYERIFNDSTLIIHDILNNKGFMRMADTLTEILPELEAKRLSAGLDSVVFFALIPQSLAGTDFEIGYIGQAIYQTEKFDLFEIKSKPESVKQSPLYCRIWVGENQRIKFIQNFSNTSKRTTRFIEVKAYKSEGGIQVPEFAIYDVIEAVSSPDDIEAFMKAPKTVVAIQNFKISKL
jgi:hypothetical protein